MDEWVPDLIYRVLCDEQLLDPLPDAPVADLTATDHLAERTDNSLRPDDLALPQPPQDPSWRPA